MVIGELPESDRSREEELAAALKDGYHNTDDVTINSRITTATGRGLGRRMTNRLEAKTFVCPPHLTATQVTIIERFFRDDRLISEIANELHMKRPAISTLRHDAMQTLIRIIWDDPIYVLPWRIQRRTEVRSRIRDYLGTLDWDKAR